MVSMRVFIVLALCTHLSQSNLTNSSSSSILSRIKTGAKCRKFIAHLDGKHQQALDAPRGTCRGILRLNKKKNKLIYKIRLCKGLTDMPLAAQIRRGDDVLAELPALTGDADFLVADGFIKANVVGNDYLEDLVEMLFAGEAYFNIKTEAYPDGELQGRIIPPSRGCLEEDESIPNDEDICSLSADSGRCKGYFPKYHFNTTSQTCEQFIYGGCGGNGNQFDSIDLCEQRCVIKQRNENGSGEIDTTTTTNAKDLCKLPQVVGPCEAAMQRFWYNDDTQACEMFLYGGCQGNDNNFESLTLCQNRCGGEDNDEEQPPERKLETEEGEGGKDTTSNEETIIILPSSEAADCTAEPNSGLCKGSFPRYFFNAASGKCEKFVYGGCYGNSNNFVTKAECESECAGEEEGGEEEPQGRNELDPICLLPQEVGPCEALHPRYWYNAGTQECETFFYGGCQGNENRFGSISACENRCGVEAKEQGSVATLPPIVAQTTAATEPPEGTEPPAETQTTAATEPSEVTEPPAAVETTAATEPSEETEPPAAAETTAATEPSEGTSPPAAAETTAATEPSEETDPTNATSPTAGTEGTIATSPTAAAETTVATSPPVKTETTGPPQEEKGSSNNNVGIDLSTIDLDALFGSLNP